MGPGGAQPPATAMTAPASPDQLTLPLHSDPRYPTRVIRSDKRRRSVSARLVDGVIEVRVPARMSSALIEEYTRDLVDKIVRKQRSASVDLDARVEVLVDRFGLPRPANIRWVHDQNHRWGSCTPADGTVRMSSRLLEVPPWVLDYVIVHELAHLLEPNHGLAFNAIVDRYPLAERARGFLLGFEHPR